jgi:predicted DCC family thiol-disulfide oxidoreductase YuxK
MDERGLFLYDGDCGFCAAVVDRLSRMRGGDGFDWRAYQTVQPLPRGLDEAALERAAFLLLPDGRTLRGFDAFRALARRLPALRPWAWLLWLPPVPPLGRALYRLIASHRRRLSAWLGLRACTLPPRRG